MNQTQAAIARAADAVGSYAELARLCGVNRAAVNNWKVSSTVPVKHCKTIEAHTGVTCRELRPDDWHLYWPEPAESI